jgi:hypothetical protein
MCARGGHHHLLPLLVKHGANVNAGASPLAIQCHVPVLLLAPLAAGFEGETPLHVAAEGNCYK